jgi:hypothetical protein
MCRGALCAMYFDFDPDFDLDPGLDIPIWLVLMHAAHS